MVCYEYIDAFTRYFCFKEKDYNEITNELNNRNYLGLANEISNLVQPVLEKSKCESGFQESGYFNCLHSLLLSFWLYVEGADYLTLTAKLKPFTDILDSVSLKSAEEYHQGLVHELKGDAFYIASRNIEAEDNYKSARLKYNNYTKMECSQIGGYPEFQSFFVQFDMLWNDTKMGKGEGIRFVEDFDYRISIKLDAIHTKEG